MKRRALIIAAERYSDNDYSDLPGTRTDAAALKDVLGRADVGAFQVTVLQDWPNAGVGREVEQFFTGRTSDELLLLYISGHGELDRDGHLYFVSTDTESGLLNSTALAARDVSKEMRHSGAGAVIVLLDCCYSGAFGRGDVRGRSSEIGELAGFGRCVMTASTAVQHSMELRTDPAGVRGGVFTQAVVKGLRTGDADRDGDGHVTMVELFDYVSAEMRRAEQTPTYSADAVRGKLVIAYNVRGPHPPIPDPDPDPPPPRIPDPPPPPPPPPPFPRRLLDSLTRARGPLSRRVTGVLLVLVGLLTAGGTRADGRVVGGGCPTGTEIRVAVGAADLAAYAAVAGDFERFVANRSHDCRSAHLYLYAAAADEVAAGLRSGWSGPADPLRNVGPHPDVWLPTAGSDVPRDLGAVVEQVVDVGQTPLVLGVPRTRVADADDALRRGAESWPQLFAAASHPAGASVPGAPTGRGWGVIRGDPATSAVARMATTALYEGGTSTASDAHANVESWIEQQLDAGRFPLGDEASLLCRQRDIHDAAGAAPSGVHPPAVILTEQQLVRFNLGYLDGTCVPGTPPGQPDDLEAFYPAQTTVVTKAAVQLRWPSGVQSDNTRAYARWFTAWLSTGDGRFALQRQGLRTSTVGDPGPVEEENGAYADWPFGNLTQGEPGADASRRTAAVYARARRPGRFLVALDASGSMDTVTDDPTLTRYELSVDALRRAAARIDGRDQLGVVTFAGSGSTPPRPVLDFTGAGGDLGARVGSLAAAVRPAGDTPLYTAIRDGAATLRHGSTADQLRVLVVLTDGRDTSGDAPPTAAQTAGVRVFVLAVGDETCGDSVLRGVAAQSGGACFDTDLNAAESVLSSMFRAVWND